MRQALIGATVIDGTGAGARPDSTVIIDGTKIVEVSQQKEFGPEMAAYDVTGKTIMPGLIDCHQHLATWAQWLICDQAHPLMYLQAKGVMAMRACLEVGCTTVRDLGGLEAGYVQAQRDGIIPGPRLQTCVNQIQPTNGLLDYMPGVGGAISPQGHTLTVPGVPAIWADGPHECRKKVREMLRYGAQVIKIFNSPHPTARPWLDPWRSLWTKEELDAIVDEAHKAGVAVTCHATSTQAVMESLQGGVDCIEHGVGMDEACLAEMVERGVWWVPTYLIFRFHATINPDLQWREVAKGLYEEHLALLPKAMKAGVKIAMGTDAAYAFGDIPGELEIMVEAGMPPMEAIVTSTRNSAQCLGMDDLVGTLEPGKEADLLVVDGDPLADMSVLQKLDKLSLVMQAGKPMAGPMVGQFPWENPGWPKPAI